MKEILKSKVLMLFAVFMIGSLIIASNDNTKKVSDANTNNQIISQK